MKDDVKGEILTISMQRDSLMARAPGSSKRMAKCLSKIKSETMDLTTHYWLVAGGRHHFDHVCKQLTIWLCCCEVIVGLCCCIIEPIIGWDCPLIGWLVDRDIMGWVEGWLIIVGWPIGTPIELLGPMVGWPPIIKFEGMLAETIMLGAGSFIKNKSPWLAVVDCVWF